MLPIHDPLHWQERSRDLTMYCRSENLSLGWLHRTAREKQKDASPRTPRFQFCRSILKWQISLTVSRRQA